MEKQLTSRLGFGSMRLPTLENGVIDESQVEKMIDIALENNVNYFDTAYFYHNGESEKVLGKLLVNRKPRESFILADKMPMSLTNSAEDLQRIFDEQLARCNVEYFDYYLLHALNKDNFRKVKEFKALEFVLEQKAQGKIKKIGFSFHDTAEVLEEILAYYPWEFVQLQLNYYDLEKEDVKKQYDLAVAKNVPIIVMEPVRGGFLARTVPTAHEIIEQAYGENQSACLALSYVDSLPGVMLTLSGMSNLFQIQDNIRTFKDPIPMDEKAQTTIQKALHAINAFKTVDCTKCEYCLPCPVGLDIPKVFEIYNNYEMLQNIFGTKTALKGIQTQPCACISCKKCEKKCPQQLEIAHHMQEFAEKIANFPD